MPSIKDQSTVDKIAEVFCSNGRNKTKTLLEMGYTDKYSNFHGTTVVFSNSRVKQAIAKIDAKTSAKLEHDRDRAIEMLHEAYAIAKRKSDNAGMVAATRELDAISNLHGQTITNIGDGLSIKVQERTAPKLHQDSA